MTGMLDIPQSTYLVKVEVLSFFMVPKFLKSVEKPLRTIMLDKFFFLYKSPQPTTGSWGDSCVPVNKTQVQTRHNKDV